MLTKVPGPPLVGEKLAMAGSGRGTATEKNPALVAVPVGVITVIGPAPALAGACAVIRVLDCTVNEGAGTPLKRTCDVPTKLLPSIVTIVPAGPLPGLNDAMPGSWLGAITTKPCVLLAVPAAVVTMINPLVAPAGTMAVIEFTPFTKKPAETPLNLTLCTLTKLVPVIVICAPAWPLIGLKKLIEGSGDAAWTLKTPALVALPLLVITVIGPVPAPDGACARICPLEETVTWFEGTPLNRTSCVPRKLLPKMSTAVPAGPLVGEKPLIAGSWAGWITTKMPWLCAVPAGVTTVMRPLAEPAGTSTTTCVGVLITKAAGVPLNSTCVAGCRLRPVIVIRVPNVPLSGKNESTIGSALLSSTVKKSPVADPFGPETVTGPVTASGGTWAMIWVSAATVNERESKPPKRTNCVPRKPLPLIVTCVPRAPLTGDRLKIEGPEGVKIGGSRTGGSRMIRGRMTTGLVISVSG